MNEKQKRRSVVQNESEMDLMIGNMVSGLMETIPDNPNDTIVGQKEGVPDFRVDGGTRNSRLQLTNEENTSKKSAPKQLPPLVIVPGASRMSQERDQLIGNILEQPKTPEEGNPS